MTSPAPARATDAHTAPARRGAWARLWRGALALTTVLAVLGLGAWWFLLTQIVPKIDQWRAPLSQQVSKTLGLTVTIGQVTGRTEGWQPELTLSDVRLFDPSGRPALQLPRITARLSAASLWPTSIWRKEVHLERLVLVRPQLDVRRDAQGRLHVAGLVFDPTRRSGDSSPAADWLLKQSLIRIEQGAVIWTDELRQARPLQLSGVDVDLRNRPGLGKRVHDWRLAATPPAAFGQRFSIAAKLSQPLWALDSGRDEPDSGWARWFGQATQASDWRTWSGQMTLDLPHVDVQSLKEHATLPFDVQGGHGRLALNLALSRGQPQDLTLTVNVQAVSMRLAPALQALAFRQVQGTLKARHEPTQTTLAWQGLSFTTDDGLVWPASQATLQWHHAPAPQPGGSAQASVLLPELQGEVWRRTTDGHFETDRLDLALLARLADRLPLAEGLRQQLAKLNPLGIGEQLSLNWQGPADAPTRFDAQGRLTGLSWQAAPEHPGLAGATLQFKANERGGDATLAIQKGWAEFPGAFEEPRIPVDTMQAKVAWSLQPAAHAGLPSALEVRITQVSFANADAEGQLEATWRTGPGQGVGEKGRYPGTLLMKGQLNRAEGNRVWRYLPAVMLADARHYVRDAVRSGRSRHVTFEVDGDLWHFPFKDDQGGRFRITVDAEDVTLDYVPGTLNAAAGASAPPPGATYWPPFTKLNGKLIFEGQGMRVEDASAVLGGVGTGTFALRKVSGRIADLDNPEPVLTIQGEGSGPLNDLLRYVAVSPVGEWTGQMLGQAQGQGRGNVTLALTLPLNHVVDAKVSGQVTLSEKDQASLRLAPGVPLMQNARGQVQFTQDTLKVMAHTRVWGQDVQIQGSRDSQGVPRFQASGMVTAEGLRSATEWPVLARMAQRMNGQTPVSVLVALNRVKPAGNGSGFSARPELQITSNLQGLGMDLPAPLNKEAATAWPLKVTHRQDDPEGKSDALLVELNGPALFKADYRRDLKGAQPRVQRGILSLTQGNSVPPMPLPPSGVMARVALPVLDLDAWQQILGALSTSGNHAPADHDSAEDFLPDTLSLKVGGLSWRQRTLRDVSATLAHPGPGVWRAQIDAQQLAGQIELKPESAAALPSGASPTNRVVARLSRLSVPAADAEAFTDQAAQQMLSAETASVPALDIVIDQFDWRGLPLGKLEIEAVNRLNLSPGNPPLPEWRLTKFRLSNADAQLHATGNWAALGAQQAAATPTRKGLRARHRAAFSFTLDLNNSGNLLTRLGLPQTIKGGKGKLGGQVSWLGSPLEPDAPSMNGDINVAISEGQFLKAEPGVAKLLGVLSLQSLPRRLILDFRDVFQQGFAFDRIEGDVKVTQGVAATRNLRMRGVQAVVLMEGQADLAQETQNLRVFVVPEINAGTASLAYAAINPAVGLGTFIAQVLLRKSIVEASTREFTITGSWADPQVDKVQRTTVPAAAGEEPASAPSTPGVKASQTPS